MCNAHVVETQWAEVMELKRKQWYKFAFVCSHGNKIQWRARLLDANFTTCTMFRRIHAASFCFIQLALSFMLSCCGGSKLISHNAHIILNVGIFYTCRRLRKGALVSIKYFNLFCHISFHFLRSPSPPPTQYYGAYILGTFGSRAPSVFARVWSMHSMHMGVLYNTLICSGSVYCDSCADRSHQSADERG